METLSNISDEIEAFIKTLLNEMEGEVEIQRNELADYFQCAPSQINYVLTTRFSIDHGYHIVSRRGGGGYIRVTRVEMDGDDFLFDLVTSRIGTKLSRNGAANLIRGMLDQQIINRREASLMMAAVDDKSIALPSSLKDVVRANIFRAMVTAILVSGQTSNVKDRE